MELSLKHSLYVNFLEIGTKITAPSVVTCTEFSHTLILLKIMNLLQYMVSLVGSQKNSCSGTCF